MKITVSLLLLFCYMFPSTAQRVGKAAQLPIDQAAADVEVIVKNNIPEQVKLIGIGEVATFAKEVTQFNTALAAYLIVKKRCRRFLVMDDEWRLRPVNDYLTGGGSTTDTMVLDSLLRHSMSSYFHSMQFRSFLTWLKKYNLRYPKDMVNLLGVTADAPIPPTYFLATYVVPADSTDGSRIGRKWADKFYADSSAFKDIEDWYRQILANPGLFARHKDLLSRCGEDLQHNKAVITVASIEQTLSKDEIDRKMSYEVSSILRKLDKRAILFGSNATIVKGDFTSKRMANEKPAATTGKLLYYKLKEKYYACATSFADSANLPILSAARREIELTFVPGTTEAKRLFQQKDYFFMPSDSAYMSQYRPSLVPFILEYRSKLVPDNNIAAADALFLFSSLTSADLILN